jgi:hypothetical protein
MQAELIRDPSDGTVRDQKSAPAPGTSQNTAERLLTSDGTETGAGTVPSGLPPTTDPREIERLNRSREWLKNYQKGQPT